MKLTGKLVKDAKVFRTAVVEEEDASASYRELLEKCLVRLCRELDIQVPLWLKRNTGEFAQFRKTSFYEDQFFEAVAFEKFEITAE